MATFSAAGNVSGYDFRQFNLARLDTAYIISASNSLIRGQIVPNQYLDLSGSFAYDGAGNLVGNTLTGYSEVMNGTTLWSFSGMTMTVYNFAYYYVFDDNNGFLNEALAGNDTITGSGFNDYLLGFGGNDTINAGNGDDWIDGGVGTDTLNGGNGNDTYLYDGMDVINDTGTVSSGSDLVVTPYTIFLANTTGIENATLLDNGQANSITGTSGANILSGNSAANTLDGSGGDDTLYGGIGADTLIGGTGDDEMFGGFGNDIYHVDSLNDSMSENYVDILWRNKLTGENHVWSMDTINVVSGVDLNVAYVPLGWEIVGAADFNRDGTSDILWRNSQTGENHLWHMNDATVVSGFNLSRPTVSLDWDVVGAADFDNDGHTDILWRNKFTGENHLWYMNDTNFISATNLSVPVIPLAWQIQALADFNTDGNVDVLWRNGQTGENHLWYMNNATVTAGYNLSVAAVSLDWEIVGAVDTGDWGGDDTIMTWINYTMASEGVENLTLAGANPLNGTGDDRANRITGNSSQNVIDGKGGNDVIVASGGTDTLTGGSGADRFVYNSSSHGFDHITDFQLGAGGDILDLHGEFSGQTINAGNIADYVQFQVAGNGVDTFVKVDRDGAAGGANFFFTQTLDNITGLDPLTLLQNGHLVVS